MGGCRDPLAVGRHADDGSGAPACPPSPQPAAFRSPASIHRSSMIDPSRPVARNRPPRPSRHGRSMPPRRPAAVNPPGPRRIAASPWPRRGRYRAGDAGPPGRRPAAAGPDDPAGRGDQPRLRPPPDGLLGRTGAIAAGADRLASGGHFARGRRGMAARCLVPTDWNRSARVATTGLPAPTSWRTLARFDDWARLAQELIRTPFFFHPAVAWLLARLDRSTRSSATRRPWSWALTRSPTPAFCST